MHSRAATGVAAAALVIAGAGLGSGPAVWLQAGAKDFSAGEPLGVSIAADGALRLAPSIATVFDADRPRIWGVATDGAGSVFVAAGEQGSVTRVRPDAEAEVFFTVPGEGLVQAIAWAPDGHLFVAAGPRGSIYRVPDDYAGDELEAWAELDVAYVWDLAVDPRGRLVAATGGAASIVRIEDGRLERLYETAEPNVTTVAVDAAGGVVAGTDGNGYVYRISESGEVFVLYDAPLPEITDILLADGSVWVGAFGTADGNAGSDAEAPLGGRVSLSAPADGAAEASGAVYRLDADGFAQTVWESASEGVYALATAPGGVLAGTGPGGHVYRVGADRSATLLSQLDAEQVVELVRVNSSVTLAATSNIGRVHRLEASYRAQGEYLSQVKDTGTTSTWGTLRWRAETPDGTAVRLYTRSGNTGTPDDTWSAWSRPPGDTNASGVASPAARFLQWRAELVTSDGGRTPTLYRVEIAYVPGNLPPRLDELQVHPAGVIYRQTAAFEDGLPFAQIPPSVAEALRSMDSSTSVSAARPFLGRPLYMHGLRTFTWEASDPNGDGLEYTLEFRGEEETTWKPLAEQLDTTQFTFDTARLADGRYAVRVSASDRPSNPQLLAKSGSATSRAFTVDNTAPVFDALNATIDGDEVRVSGRVHDATSLLRQLRYSVDGAVWHTVLPADGAADSAIEAIEFSIGDLTPGEHTVVVQVTDTALNRSAGKVVVVVADPGNADRSPTETGGQWRSRK